MGYAVYEDRAARDLGVDRWAGYGVPAECDMPGCTTQIDRGLGYRCEEHVDYGPDGTDGTDGTDEIITEGCHLSFCTEHLHDTAEHAEITPKPDSAEWVEHMLTDESWQTWRDENPARVAAMRGA